MPAWCRLSARLSPPIPPPTTITCIPLRFPPLSASRVRRQRRSPHAPLSEDFSPCGRTHVLDGLEARELDILQLAVRLLDLADVDVVDHVAGPRVGRHRPPRAFPGYALYRRRQRVAVNGAVRLRERLVDEVHAVVAAHRHEVRAIAGLLAIGSDEGLV